MSVLVVEEAANRLREAGLGVQLGPDGHISAYACPREPPRLLKEQGVTMTWEFGFSIERIDGEWFLREGPPKPSEVCSNLEDAVQRGIALFNAFREAHPDCPGTTEEL